MTCEKLFATIDEFQPLAVELLADLCRLESPSEYKPGVDAVGRYLAEAAMVRGWQVEILEQPVAGNVVCITLNPNAPGAPITFSGHMDTVHPVGSFGLDPVRLEDDKMFGPGVSDCKGGIAAAFLAMEALDRCGFDARPVRLLLQSDEECGSRLSQKATIRYMCERAGDSAAFINVEPYTPGKICVQRKGIVNFKFEIIGQEAHASQCAVSGANAIAEAAYKILEMEKFKDHLGLTCSVGTIRGGTVPNTVAGRCEFVVNVRFATQEQYRQIAEHAQTVAETTHIPGCTCRVTETSTRLCMERTERNLRLMEAMNRIFEANGLSALEPVFNLGGSDAAEVTAAGIPCVDSLGAWGGGIHSPGEFVYLASLAESAKRLAAVAVCL